MVLEEIDGLFHLPQSVVLNAFSVLGIPTGDTQNTSDLGTGVPKTRGYPNHCDIGRSVTVDRKSAGSGNELRNTFNKL